MGVGLWEAAVTFIMSPFLAIDPGPVSSAAIWMDGDTIIDKDIFDNSGLLAVIRTRHIAINHLAIEMIASYGMAVGKDVFETCVWIGRFIEACQRPHTKVYRKDVKMHLCGSTRAKDGNIRQALIDRFGPPGTKKNPGKLYGISKDLWSALAVAVTWMDTQS